MAYSRRACVAACAVSALILGAARPGWSMEPVGRDGVLSHPAIVQGSPFIEGLNPNVPVDDSRYYGVLWFALPYTPSVSYLIDRVEFIHGEGSGTITIQIRTDSGGQPSNVILTQGSHQLQQAVGLQGADMPPASLTAGTPYWVVLQVVTTSQASVGPHGQGVEITYLYGDDGATWNANAPTEVWIARFFGDTPVPVASAAWGSVKARYRYSEPLGTP